MHFVHTPTEQRTISSLAQYTSKIFYLSIYYPVTKRKLPKVLAKRDTHTDTGRKRERKRSTLSSTQLTTPRPPFHEAHQHSPSNLPPCSHSAIPSSRFVSAPTPQLPPPDCILLFILWNRQTFVTASLNCQRQRRRKTFLLLTPTPSPS